MKKSYYLILSLLIFSCSNKKVKSSNEINKTKLENITPEKIIEKENLIIGERIDGPANVRDTINGKLLFELKDMTLVETTPTKNNWLEIGVFCEPSIEESGKFFILPNKEIYDENKNIIGTTKDTVEILMGGEDYILINGYTHLKNIKPYSIPEKALVELLKNKKKHISQYEKYLRDFKFEISGLGGLENVEQYFINQSFMVDISPRDRITLIFRNRNLIGLIHARDIKVENYDTYELIRGHKLTVESSLKKSIINEIIENKISVYNSID